MEDIHPSKYNLFNPDQDIWELDAPTRPLVQRAVDWYSKRAAETDGFFKRDLSLREMAPFAHQLWLIRIAEDGYYISVYSTVSIEVSGSNLTGHKVGDEGTKWEKYYHAARDGRRPVIVRNIVREFDKPHLETEVAILPLMGPDREISHLLCPYDLFPNSHLRNLVNKSSGLS